MRQSASRRTPCVRLSPHTAQAVAPLSASSGDGLATPTVTLTRLPAGHLTFPAGAHLSHGCVGGPPGPCQPIWPVRRGTSARFLLPFGCRRLLLGPSCSHVRSGPRSRLADSVDATDATSRDGRGVPAFRCAQLRWRGPPLCAGAGCYPRSAQLGRRFQALAHPAVLIATGPAVATHDASDTDSLALTRPIFPSPGQLAVASKSSGFAASFTPPDYSLRM
jgi:hypothetical protein